MSKGLSSVKTLTSKEIANKWNLSLSVVAKKIAAGVKVEKEHTKSTKQANEIARDHIGERPDYYDKLDKMEKQPIVKEESVTSGVRGLGYETGDPAAGTDYIAKYINTNVMSYDDVNGNKLEYIEKSHRNLHDRKIGFKEFNPKKIKTNSNKDLAESLGSDYGTAAVPVIGDLSGTPRKVSKVDEVKLPPKVRKAVATGMTLANLYTAGDVASRAQQGIGSPMKDMVTAASTLSGTKGWAAYGADKARQAYEYVKGKRMKENKNLVPANTVERGIYEAITKNADWPNSRSSIQMDEISAELVGKVSNARFKQGKAPSRTLSRAINKKFVELQLKKEREIEVPFTYSHKRSHEKSSTHVRRLATNAMKQYTKEETKMDTKDLINEALDNILEENLVAMKENFQIALQEKMMEKLEERKKIIASDYFAQ